mmetsp:Transcript_10266/g.31630  ORF Transcript_10266/g.31630 Transcript_10266/m.31630 type:complete len:404 (-) Transcript_10266:600-1811(-)
MFSGKCRLQMSAVKVDHVEVLDLASSLSVHERDQIRAKVLGVVAHMHQKERLAIATQRILQQTSQLAVSVGDRACVAFRGERREHIAQRTETAVDLARLALADALGLGLPETFAASQVHQVQLAHLERSVGLVARTTLHHERDDRVRARRAVVHLGFGAVAATSAGRQQLERMQGTVHRRAQVIAAAEKDRVCGHVLADHDAIALLRGQTTLAVVRIEEIGEGVTVQLHKGAADGELALGRSRIDLRKQALHAARHHPRVLGHGQIFGGAGWKVRAEHGVRLPGAAGAVRKHGRVEAAHHGVHVGRHLAKHALLGGARLEDVVKVEEARASHRARVTGGHARRHRGVHARRAAGRRRRAGRARGDHVLGNRCGSLRFLAGVVLLRRWLDDGGGHRLMTRGEHS